MYWHHKCAEVHVCFVSGLYKGNGLHTSHGIMKYAYKCEANLAEITRDLDDDKRAVVTLWLRNALCDYQVCVLYRLVFQRQHSVIFWAKDAIIIILCKL